MLNFLKFKKEEDRLSKKLKEKIDSGDLEFYGNAGLKMTDKRLNSKEFKQKLVDLNKRLTNSTSD